MAPPELRARGKADFEQLPGWRSPPSMRVAMAIAHLYTTMVRDVADALGRGNSVLIRGPGLLAKPFVDALQIIDQQLRPQDFHVVSLAHAREEISSQAALRDPTIEEPTRTMLRQSFQRFFYEAHASDVTLTIDFLDTLLCAPGPSLVDTIVLLNSFPSQRVLAFADLSTPLPAALRFRLSEQFVLPQLSRATMWALLAYDEVQNVLGATSLSVAHQVALFHALGRLSVSEARATLATRVHEGLPTSTPFHAIATMASWLARDATVTPCVPPSYAAAVAELRRLVVEPYAQYATASSAADVDALDQRLARGVLVLGPTEATIDLAYWLAGEIGAAFYSTTGAALTDIGTLFSSIRTLPAVILVKDLGAALLDGAATRTLLATWDQIGSAEPLILVAQADIDHTLPLPLPLARRFPYVLHLPS